MTRQIFGSFRPLVREPKRWSACTLAFKRSVDGNLPFAFVIPPSSWARISRELGDSAELRRLWFSYAGLGFGGIASRSRV